jgi:two-component system, OmpR family, response regulator
MAGLRKILHVEDDEDILQIVQLSLEALGGFDVLQCASGAEAIEKAADFVPDLILIDFMMPGMNGLVTLQELRKIDSLAEVPAIFMSAKNLVIEGDEVLRASVIGSIQKPFDAMGLPEKVLKIWQQSGRG